MSGSRLAPAALAAVACLAVPASAHAVFPGTNGRISFDRAVQPSSKENSDLWSIAADGTGWGAVVSRKDLSEGDAVWSPDGRRLVYSVETRPGTEQRPPSFEIAVVNADGTGARRLTRFNTLTVAPSWTPDGKRIVFASVYETVKQYPFSNDKPPPPGQIYSMAADGTDVQRLTRTKGGVGGMDCTDPVVSPDGATIAAYCVTFGRNRPLNGGIYTLPIGGGSPKRITPNGGVDEFNPSWSPDGKTIAIEVGRFTEGRGRTDIALMNADGSNLRTFASTTWFDTNPVFSPDGTMLAFTSDRDTKPATKKGEQPERLNRGFELYTVRLDTGKVTRFTHNKSRDIFPDWGPAPTP